MSAWASVGIAENGVVGAEPFRWHTPVEARRFSLESPPPPALLAVALDLRIVVGKKRRNQPLTDERRELFLAALRECGNIGQAAREASPNALGDASATFR